MAAQEPKENSDLHDLQALEAERIIKEKAQTPNGFDVTTTNAETHACGCYFPFFT